MTWGFVHTIRQLLINWPFRRGYFWQLVWDALWWPLLLWRGGVEIGVNVWTHHQDKKSGHCGEVAVERRWPKAMAYCEDMSQEIHHKINKLKGHLPIGQLISGASK